MKKHRDYILFLIFLYGTLAEAQLQTAHWYFGQHAGLDFSSGSPVIDTNSQITPREGCTSISDEYGNLLFYTDGRYVYNSTHNLMQNGSGLRGDNSSTSSAVILPKPDDCNLYYIFTIDVQYAEVQPWRPRRGIEYNIVDMSLNGGLGAVIEKNIEVPINGQQQGYEKLAAVSNADRTGYWIVTHLEGNFYAFSVTGAGVSLEPMVSPSGINPPTLEVFGTGLGYLKASPDGSKLAMGMDNPEKNDIIGSLSIYAFNNATGVISNEIILSPPNSEEGVGFYGIEFSRDSRALYTESINLAHEKKLIQYDLTSSDIIQSKYVILEYNGLEAALQRGLDDKIYVAKPTDFYLGRIENPNTIYNTDTGEVPVYTDNAIYLQAAGEVEERWAWFGLPTFLNHYFRISITVNGLSIRDVYCTGASLDFDFCSQGGEIDSIQWNFGDGNTSDEMYPEHYYNAPGEYVIILTLIVDGEEYIRTFEITITGPEAEDALLETCDTGEEHTFVLTDAYPQIGAEDYTITFHLTRPEAETGENAQPTTHVTGETTNIWVRVEDENDCFVIRELTLAFVTVPSPVFETPVTICAGSTADLTVTADEVITVKWYLNEDDTTPFYNGTAYTTDILYDTIIFWVETAVETENGLTCISERFPLEVIVNPQPELNPLDSQFICDIDFDGTYITDLTELENLLTNNPTGITFEYFESPEDLNNNNPIPNPENHAFDEFSASIWVKVTNENDCFSLEEVVFETLPDVLVTIPTEPVLNCEDEIDLTVEEGNITSIPDAEFTYYLTEADAQQQTGVIENPEGFVPETNPGTVYIRVASEGYCPVIVPLNYEITTLPVASQNAYSSQCDGDGDGFVTFSLPAFLPELGVTNPAAYTIHYFENLQNAIEGNTENAIENPAAYNVPEGQSITIYVRIAIGDCFVVRQIHLTAYAKPELNEVPTQFICNDDFDGIFNEDLTILETLLADNPYGLTFEYFASPEDLNNNNPIPNPENHIFNSFPASIWVKVTNENNCPGVKQVYFETLPTIPATVPTETIISCEDEIDLTVYETEITSVEGAVFTYYLTEEDAWQQINPVSNPDFYNPEQTEGIIYIRMEADGYCPAIVPLSYQIAFFSGADIDLPETVYFCPGGSVMVDAGNDFPQEAYIWTWTGGSFAGSVLEITETGLYTLTLTDENGCTKSFTVTAEHYAVLQITGIEVEGTTIIVFAFVPDGSVIEYSLDHENWQTSNVFTGLVSGVLYTVYVRANGCDPVTVEVPLILIPNFISPNNDGHNDVWEILPQGTIENAHLRIFDRYGKLLYEKVSSNGFTWDGKYQGNPLPSTSYWYILDIPAGNFREPIRYKGHLTIKNY